MRPTHTQLLTVLLFATLAVACTEPSADGPALSTPPPSDTIGTVDFATSCDGAVADDFNAAVAKLHSFEFEEARGNFEAIQASDPDCAVAGWGVAMTYYHPL